MVEVDNMGNNMEKDVAPGTFLGTEEEYIAGSGTYIEGGKVYSSAAGVVRESDKNLSVDQKAALHSVKPGTIVYGRVEDVFEPIARVSVIPVSSKGVRFAGLPDQCVIRISNVKMGYVKQIHDEFKIGDIIKAKVIDVSKGEVALGTKEDNLGVVKAFCTTCRSPLCLVGSSLVCGKCGGKEMRKLSKEYWCVK